MKFWLLLLLLSLAVGCAPLEQVRWSSSRTLGEGTVTAPGEYSSEDASLAAKIRANTPPRRAASLRLTEEGRKLLGSGHYQKALTRMEQALAIDSSNPYVYYFLGKAHFHLTKYRQSVEFLDVAESLLSSQAFWLGEVYNLKGKNYHELGMLEPAHRSYTAALRLNPKNREAAIALSRVQRELKVPTVR
jgi:tetratricopeptide (TPR) repeat protein